MQVKMKRLEPQEEWQPAGCGDHLVGIHLKDSNGNGNNVLHNSQSWESI